MDEAFIVHFSYFWNEKVPSISLSEKVLHWCAL